MLKRFKRNGYKQWLFAVSILVASALACNNSDVADLDDEGWELFSRFDKCNSAKNNRLSDSETRLRMKECMQDYTSEEEEYMKNARECSERPECMAFFNDIDAVEEEAPDEQEAPQPEVIPAEPEGSLALSGAAATPEDCAGELTEQSLSMSCNFRVQVEAVWESTVTPAYIHCDLGSRGTSTHELSNPNGSMVIEFVANNIEVVHHVDRIPDDRAITFQCALSDSIDHSLALRPGTMAHVRCLDPAYSDTRDPAFCQAAIDSWISVWSAP